MKNKQVLVKLAQIKLAINYVLRERQMTKQAYGVGDDFEYIDRMPWLGSYTEEGDSDDVDSYIKEFKGQLADLAEMRKQLYDAPPYAGYTPEMYVSKHRYHMNDWGWPSEIKLDKYIQRVNQAIEKRDRRKLQDLAKYWSIRGAITDPKAREAITKAIEEYRKTNPETFE